MLAALGIALATLQPVAPAQPAVVTGEMTLSHGFVVDAATGKRRSVVGLVIPFRAERVSTMRDKAPASKQDSNVGFSQQVPPLVYKNDNGTNTYFYTDPYTMPSAADDIVMSPTGAGASWKWITTGLYAEYTGNFLWRWKVYDTDLGNTGPGNMEFAGLLADFGGRFALQDYNLQPGAYKITFDISVVAVNVPDGECYVCQQFRMWTGYPPNPEAPFRPDLFNLFSIGGVTLGSSQDYFWYDDLPGGNPNSIYEFEEHDQLGDEGGNVYESNFLFEIYAGNPVEVALPVSVTLVRGNHVNGDYVDTWYSDNSYYSARPGIAATPQLPPLEVMVEGALPVQNPASLKFLFETACSSTGITDKVDLFNYSTGQWVNFYSGAVGLTDQTNEVVVQGTISNYVNQSTRRVRARLTYRQNGPATGWPWTVRFDLTNWQFTRP